MTVTGQQVYDLANTQLGKSYIFGVEVAPTWAAFHRSRAWDCSELVQVVCNLLGVEMPDGSQNQRQHCRSVRPVTLATARTVTGALVFSSHHVAITHAGGFTIEAANRRVGVIHGAVNDRFVDAGLIPGVYYPELDATPPPPPQPGSIAELQRAIFYAKQFRIGVPDGPGVLNEHSPGGDAAVRFVQTALNRLDPNRHLPVDGVFGDATRAAVIDLQRFCGFNELGTVGPGTWNVLYP